MEGADRVAGQLRGDKEYPFSGITKSGRVCKKVPESDARSVELTLIDGICQIEEQKQKKTFEMNCVVQCIKGN